MFVFPGWTMENDSLRNVLIVEWANYEIPRENSVREILKKRSFLEKQLRLREGDESALQENGAQAVNKVALLYKEHKNVVVKKSVLKKILLGVDLTKESIVHCDQFENFIENYYFLQFIKEGAVSDEAQGGMFFNTSLPTVGNAYDYERYRRILELNNPALILSYLTCLQSVFRYNGYTNGLEEIRPLIEKFMPEGELKESLRDLYKKYAHLRSGMEAPAFFLKDFRGKTYSLKDFRGRILVVDVWATWCGGCIAKLPAFLALKDKFSNRDDIEFITISIDRQGSYNRWKYALPRLNLMGTINLFAPDDDSDFSENYNITGIPRYFLIDKEGKIVTVYAPSPGKDLEVLINQMLDVKI